MRVWLTVLFCSLTTLATAQALESLDSLLNSLDPEQASKARFPFAAEERTEWTYVPWGHVGLPLLEMSEDQRGATDAWVRSALSPSGVETYLGVIELENELWENTWFKWFRDPGKYYLAVFGDPGTNLAAFRVVRRRSRRMPRPGRAGPDGPGAGVPGRSTRCQHFPS